MPAATAGAVYLRSVLRSTPRLVAISFCDRPAYQWVKISTTSIMSKVLLANVCTPSLAAGQQGGASGRRRARPGTDTHAVPMGNYVIAGWGTT
jgi:hypothetical protein